MVQIAYPDAHAYARWGPAAADQRPNGSTPPVAADTTPVGADAAPGGQLMANTWQGRFPYRNDGALRLDRHVAGGQRSRRTASAWST